MAATEGRLEELKIELKRYIKTEIALTDTKANNALAKSTEALEIASKLDSENAVNKTVRSFTGRY